MNEYNLNVDFSKGRISTNLRRLVQNDYNTTKLNFTFDKEGRVLFKMLYPDGTQYVDEIKNNELVFGAGILNQEGTYEYEISLYSEDGRLTDYAVKSFEVRSELVDTDELVAPDDRVPVLDTLINEVSTIKQDVEDGKYNGKDGSDGQDGVTPTIGENGNWFIDGIDTGMPSQGPEGPQGQPGKDGGISLEEVTTITGELGNLNTKDKSNLVNAINEVLNNSGSNDIPIVTCNVTRFNNNFSGDDLINLGQAINDAKDFINDGFWMIVRPTSYGYPNGGVMFYLSYVSDYTTSVQYVFSYRSIVGSDAATSSSQELQIFGSWNNDIFTISSAKFSRTDATLVKNTELSNYASKSYVDNAIASAITTVLEGDY